jgi:hypothetical protein
MPNSRIFCPPERSEGTTKTDPYFVGMTIKSQNRKRHSTKPKNCKSLNNKLF